MSTLRTLTPWMVGTVLALTAGVAAGQDTPPPATANPAESASGSPEEASSESEGPDAAKPAGTDAEASSAAAPGASAEETPASAEASSEPEAPPAVAEKKRSRPSAIRSIIVIDDPDGGAMTRQLSLSATLLYASMANRTDSVGLFVESKKPLRFAPAPLNVSQTFSDIRSRLAAVTETQAAPFGSVAAYAASTFGKRPPGTVDALVVLAHTNRGGNAQPRLPAAAIKKLAKRKIPVYVVGFGRKVKLEAYEKLASASGGGTYRVERGDDLKRAFSHIFVKLHETESLPVVGDTVVMDDSIEEATVVLPKKSKKDRNQLVTPGDRVLGARTKYPGVTWKSFKEYDLVRIANPEAGKWKVRQPSKLGGVVGHVNASDVRLEVEVGPRRPMVGASFQIRAHLRKEDRVINAYAQLKHLVIEAEVRDPAGRLTPVRLRRGDHGMFTADLENELQGYHEVKITAYSPEIQRERRITYRVNPACFTGRFATKQRTVDVEMSRTCPRFAQLYAMLHVEREGELIAKRSFRRDGRRLRVAVPAPELGHQHDLKVVIKGKTMDGHVVRSDGGGPFVDAARDPTWADYAAAVGTRLLVLNVPVAIGLFGLLALQRARRARESDFAELEEDL